MENSTFTWDACLSKPVIKSRHVVFRQKINLKHNVDGLKRTFKFVDLFQAEFLLGIRENKWPRRVELSDGEYIMMHNANVMVHFVPNNESENWSGEDSVARPKVVRRGVVDIEDEISDGKFEELYFRTL